jgi:hypothetical protein
VYPCADWGIDDKERGANRYGSKVFPHLISLLNDPLENAAEMRLACRMAFLREICERVPPADYRAWHRWRVFLPVRCIGGNLAWGAVWRRHDGTAWEFDRRDYAEDENEWIGREW